MKLLTLDPATHYTGYAVWSDAVLIQFGVIRAHKSSNWDVRCLELNSKIRNLIVDQKMTHCVAEFPEFQSGKRGLDAAKAGDTLKLAYLCGSISCGWQLHSALYLADQQRKYPTGGMDLDVPSVEPMIFWVSPSRWKGQLPKDVCAARCHERYGWLAKTEIEKNASDAIMIGDWFLREAGLKTCAHVAKLQMDY